MTADNHTSSRIRAFPLAWVTTGRNLLLVGGCGGELCRLAQALKFDWAKIHMVRPEGAKTLCEACCADPRVTVSHRRPTEQDVAEAHLLIESTNDAALAEELAAHARTHHVTLNAMDKLEHCDVYYCSLILRESLVLAITTGGDSPAIASALRRWLDQKVGPGWGRAAGLLAKLRAQLPRTSAGSEVLRDLAQDADFLAMIEADDAAGMKRLITEAHDRFRSTN